MSYETPDHNMEMPCPCQKCGGWFDLHDGCGSDKWYPNTVICEDCSKIEQEEIEIEEEISELKSEIEDAEYTIKNGKERMEELEKKLKLLQEHEFEPKD
jgi:lysyl-tRNA synthetase class I